MLDVIELFGERDTRDELGLGSVRDAFADQLFPGTSTIQTRARYFLLVPWIYQFLEEHATPSSSIAEKARKCEVRLIHGLCKSDDTNGVIGKQAKENLLRLPSNVYWSGLGAWGIRTFPGSQEQYHRSLDQLYLRRKGRQVSRREYEGESETDGDLHNWHAGLPPRPHNFTDEAVLSLNFNEADYLSLQIQTNCPKSLMAFLVRERWDVSNFNYAWELREGLPQSLREILDHAENFSHTINGAQLLYNLLLARKRQHSEWIDDYKNRLHEWWIGIEERDQGIRTWQRDHFWQIVAAGNSRVSHRSKVFINTWIDILLSTKTLNQLLDHANAAKLIEEREQQLKRGLARLTNQQALEHWGGDAGSRQLDLRWPVSRNILTDILAGWEAGDA